MPVRLYLHVIVQMLCSPVDKKCSSLGSLGTLCLTMLWGILIYLDSAGCICRKVEKYVDAAPVSKDRIIFHNNNSNNIY